jgi:hypothetical protein
MNDIYIFHIYILIIHYIMQLYNIRVWLASRLRAEPSLVPQLVKAPSRAELGQAPSCTELSRARLSSFPALVGMSDRKHYFMPVDTHAKVSDDDGALVGDAIAYWSPTRALQYLTFTRPNIAYTV